MIVDNSERVKALGDILASISVANKKTLKVLIFAEISNLDFELKAKILDSIKMGVRKAINCSLSDEKICIFSSDMTEGSRVNSFQRFM